MRTNCSALRALFVILNISGLQEASASLVLVSNLNIPHDGSQTGVGDACLLGSCPGVHLEAVQARPFITNGGLYELDAIVLGTGIEHAYGSGFLSISIYSHGFDRPGILVPNGDSIAPIPFDQISAAAVPSAQILLEPNTTYWVGLSAYQTPDDTRFFWQNLVDETFESDVVGADLSHASASVRRTGWEPITSRRILPLAVYATPIPEPSFAVFGLLGLGLFLMRRRRS